MNGYSLFKAYLLIVKHSLDVICIQETWIPPSAIKPHIPGYQLIEERRERGKRGGIAMYIRNSLNIVKTLGNQYA
jgi:exonuclease III